MKTSCASFKTFCPPHFRCSTKCPVVGSSVLGMWLRCSRRDSPTWRSAASWELTPATTATGRWVGLKADYSRKRLYKYYYVLNHKQGWPSMQVVLQWNKFLRVSMYSFIKKCIFLFVRSHKLSADTIQLNPVGLKIHTVKTYQTWVICRHEIGF